MWEPRPCLRAGAPRTGPRNDAVQGEALGRECAEQPSCTLVGSATDMTVLGAL